MKYYIRRRGEDEATGPFSVDELTARLQTGAMASSDYMALRDSGQTVEELRKHWNWQWTSIADAIKGVNTESKAQPALPSWGIAWGFIIAAAAAKLIGDYMARSHTGSSGGSSMVGFVASMDDLQTRANIEGWSAGLMVIFGVIGIILLVRAFLAHNKTPQN